MSSSLRPWYKWFPKDFTSDEKVRCLPPLAELIYRRALDLMWQSNDIRIPNAMPLLYESLGGGIEKDVFNACWERIQYPGFALLQLTDDEKWVFSPRLQREANEIKAMIAKRQAAGIKGSSKRWETNAKQTHNKRITSAMANAKQTNNDTDTDKDIKKNIKKKKTRLSESFDLDLKLIEYAVEKGMDKTTIGDEFEAFQLYHKKNGSEFVDWSAAWQTWVRNFFKFKKDDVKKSDGDDHRGPRLW
jgi:hypothetical protein